MLTLGQVENSSVANVAGVNVTDPQFAQLVNDACEQLMDIGSWWGTVQAICGCIYDKHVVWPVKVDAVLGMDVYGHRAHVENYWYQFIPLDDRHRQWASGYHDGYRTRVGFSGTSPLFNPPSPSSPALLQFTCDNPADIGKTVTVYGTDTNGHEVFATRTDGSSQRGIVLTLVNPFVRMPVVMTTVSAIVKDITSGTARAWRFVPGTGITEQAGIYRAGDTSPQFIRSEIPNCGCAQSINALVKLGFQPVNQASDILPLDCLDAIKLQVQAIKKRDAGDGETGLMFERMAIRRLNMQMRKRFPQEQFILAFRPFGSDTLERQKIGFLI